MKKIFLILILLFQFNGAQAKSFTQELNELSREERTKLFYKEIDNVPDNMKLFIPKNTLACSSKKGYSLARNHIINNGGVSANKYYLDSVGCRAMDGYAIGFVLGYEKNSKIIKVIHTFPFVPKKTLQSYFNSDDLMTVEQRKSMAKI